MKTIEINNTPIKEEKKMTLVDYYHSIPDRRATPRTQFLEEICQRCEVDINTSRNWVKGRTMPQKESYFRILSEMTGIPEENLFANNNPSN